MNQDPEVTAKLLIGTPYFWGGNDPRGIDCSGLVCFAWHLAGCKLLAGFPYSNDLTSGELFELLPATDKPESGDAAFYSSGPTSRISHVVLVVSGGRTVGANHGDRRPDGEAAEFHISKMRERGAMVTLEKDHLFRSTFRGFRKMPPR